MKNKKIIYIAAAVFLALFLIVLAAASTKLGVSKTDPDAESAGIRNPVNIFAPEEKDSTVLEEEEQQKEEVTEELIDQAELMIDQCISEGLLTRLDDYLLDVENKYRDTSDPTLIYKVDRIHAIRQDISRLSGITQENHQEMYKYFMSPEILAAALFYEPVSEKYLANMNLAGVVIPQVKTGTNIFLTREDLLPEDEEILRDISSNHTDDYIEAARYRATVFHRTLSILLIRNGTTGLWRTYTVQVESGESFYNTQHVKELMTSLEIQNAEWEIDNIVRGETMEDLMPEHFAGDEDYMPNRQPNVPSDFPDYEADVSMVDEAPIE